MNTAAKRTIVNGHRGRVGAVIAIAVALCPAPAGAQTAKEVKGATPLVAIANEPPPKLIVDPPIPEQLALGRVFYHRALDTCTTTWTASRGRSSTRAGKRW